MEKLRASNGSSSAYKLEWDSFGYYLDQIGQIPVPSREEQYEMARVVQADLAAVKAAQEATDLDAIGKAQAQAQAQADKAVIKMTFSNLRLVPSTIKRYKRPLSIDLFDLLQGGNIGLIRAVKKFDPELGYMFSTYAEHWIRAGMQNVCFQMSGSLRKPRSVLEATYKIPQIQAKTAQTLKRMPKTADIAERLDLPAEEIEKMVSLDKMLHLEAPLSNEAGSSTFGDLLASAPGYAPEDNALETERQRVVKQALDRLDKRKAAIVKLRFGFEDGQFLSYAAIGRIFDLSGEHIRQLLQQALVELRQQGNQLHHLR